MRHLLVVLGAAVLSTVIAYHLGRRREREWIYQNSLAPLGRPRKELP